MIVSLLLLWLLTVLEMQKVGHWRDWGREIITRQHDWCCKPQTYELGRGTGHRAVMLLLWPSRHY